MPLASENTQLERLKTELQALEDLLPYLTGERRDGLLVLIDRLRRELAEHPLSKVVVISPRRVA